MYRIGEITLTPFESKDLLPVKICKKLGLNLSKKELISNIKIVKESIDARKKKDIKLVYTIDFDFPEKLSLKKAEIIEYKVPVLKSKIDKRPVIVGFGPAGIFVALILAQAGLHPIVIERGKNVIDRTKDVENFWKNGILNEESNVQFGEGGAGTFSDGKLTTGIKDFRIRKVLTELYSHGGKEEILYRQKPHIGTDKLKGIIANIRKTIIKLGGEVRFSSKAVGLVLNNTCDKVEKVKVLDISENREYTLEVDNIVFATGHSARETYEMLYENGISITQKPMSMGVRIEHSQSLINKAQYGSDEIAEILGAAEYKLNCKTASGRGVYTFCMCPGGEVIMSSSKKGCLVSNGMSYSKRDGCFANSGLLVDVRVEDYQSEHPLAGMYFQEKYEKIAFEKSGGYKLLETTWSEFKNSPLAESLPKFVVESIVEAMPVLGRKLKGFDSDDTVFKGIETRSSAPVRIWRNDYLESNISGVYTSGEGAGYAGGIMSASVDGIKIAEKIIEKLQGNNN